MFKVPQLKNEEIKDYLKRHQDASHTPTRRRTCPSGRIAYIYLSARNRSHKCAAHSDNINAHPQRALGPMNLHSSLKSILRNKFCFMWQCGWYSQVGTTCRYSFTSTESNMCKIILDCWMGHSRQ